MGSHLMERLPLPEGLPACRSTKGIRPRGLLEHNPHQPWRQKGELMEGAQLAAPSLGGSQRQHRLDGCAEARSRAPHNLLKNELKAVSVMSQQIRT